MIDICRKTIKQTDCGQKLESQHPSVYPEFSVCLPFGRQLVWDGTGLRLNGTAQIADGSYGLITVQNGCITGAAEQPACEYTPAPCTPAATPCGGGGSGQSTGGSVVLQPSADNLLTTDPQGRLGVSLAVSGSDGIKVEGTGTATDPLRFSYDVSVNDFSTYLNSGNDAIRVTGQGTSEAPYTITHKDNAETLGPGEYGGFTIDSYGHVTAYEEQVASITQIQGKPGVTVTTSGTLVTIGVPLYNIGGDYQLGAYTVHIEPYGTVSSISREFAFDTRADTSSDTVPETRVIDPRFNVIEVDQFGSVRSSSAIPDDQLRLGTAFAELCEANRDITSMTFVTKTSGYFRVRYTGYLEKCSLSGAKLPGDWDALPPTWALKIDNKKVAAYGRGANSAQQAVEIFTISDAMYGAGTHTVTLTCSEDEYKFKYLGFLSVDVVGRSDAGA